MEVTMNNDIYIGKIEDLDELEILYDDLNDYLGSNVNYPSWIKGVYPIRETAKEGIMEKSLFVLKIDNKIAGSIILNHKEEEVYNQVKWGIDAEHNDIIVIHTLAVHPNFMHQGVAIKLLNFAKEYAIEQSAKAIRLDTSIHNKAAIALYEKLGYKYVGVVDLGLGYKHLKWFKLYELII